MIVLVNPVSSGTALADAFDERDSDCLHVYDPDRFSARISAPYQPSRALAKVFLRAHREGTLAGMPGLAVLRGLPAFHSIARLPKVGAPVPDRLLTTGASGIAFLVHDSESVLTESLSVLHELEDAGNLYHVEG